jgi:hypothetical protein
MDHQSLVTLRASALSVHRSLKCYLLCGSAMWWRSLARPRAVDSPPLPFPSRYYMAQSMVYIEPFPPPTPPPPPLSSPIRPRFYLP